MIVGFTGDSGWNLGETLDRQRRPLAERIYPEGQDLTASAIGGS